MYSEDLVSSLCLIGGLWAVQTQSTSDIIDGESMLTETTGVLFLKSYNTKMNAIVLPIIKI